MKNKIVFVLLFLTLIFQIIIVINSQKSSPIPDKNFVEYHSLTNILDTFIDSRLSSSSSQVNSTSSITSNSSNIQLLANTYTRSYSCSFVGGRPALQFSGSSAIYFNGEFCPYGKLLTITPYRCLLKQGSDLSVLYNDNINVDLISDDVSNDNNNDVENTFPHSLNFFGNK